MRLRLALRAIVSLSLMIGAAAGLAHLLHLKTMAFSLGFLLSLFGNASVRDPTPGGQVRTLLLLPVVAGASFVLASLASAWPVLQDLIFLAVIFASVWGRRFGPRGFAAGMIGVGAFFFGLLVGASLDQAPWHLLGVAVATAVVFLVRFVLLRSDPEADLNRMATAFRARVSRVLERLEHRLRADGEALPERRQLRRELGRLNEAAIALDTQLDDPHMAGRTPRMGLELFRAQLATERVVVRAVQGSVLSPQARRALADSARRLRTGAPVRTGVEAGSQDPRPGFVPALAELEAACAALVRAAKGGGDQQERETRDAAVTPPRPEPGRSHEPFNLQPTTRLALQATLACGLAILGGELVSPQRWYWAVFTAFLVFTGVDSRGETLWRGLQRTLGTFAGVAASVLLAGALSGQHVIEFAILLPCVFGAYYFQQAAYTVSSFFITLLLAMLYALMGRLTPGLMWLRLEETAVGAAAAGLVAMTVLARRTAGRLRSELSQYLDALEALACGAARRMLETGDQATLRPLVRKLGERQAAVRASVLPLDKARRVGAAPPPGNVMSAVLACSYWAHELGMASRAEPFASSADQGRIRDRLADLRARIDEVRERLEAAPGAPVGPAPAPHPEPVASEARLQRALHAYDGLSDAVNRLGEACAPQAAATRAVPPRPVHA